jgi:arginine deiminase
MLNNKAHEDDANENSDISLTDEQYQVFEQALIEELITLRAEAQKNLTYFSSAHGVKIANVIITSNDINGLGEKLAEYLDTGSGTLNMQPDGIIEIDDYTIINETGEEVDCACALGLGAILSNYVRGDIYE